MIRTILSALILALFATSVSAAEADSLRARPSIWADVTAVAGSAAVNAGLTEVLKHTVHAGRPDGSGLDSWPSRHTSYAFAILGSAGFRAARYSGWWLVGAHTAANIVGLQRIAADRHYPRDVLGGAAIGFASVAAGEALSRLIFGGQGPLIYRGEVPGRGSVDAFTTAVFPLGQIGYGQQLHTGEKTGLRYTCQLHEIWGLSVEASTTSFPLEWHFDRSPILHTWGAAAGAVARFGLDVCDIEGRLMAGMQYNTHLGDIHRFSFTALATCAALFNISRTCAVGAEAGYELRTMNSILNAATLSILTRVRF